MMRFLACEHDLFGSFEGNQKGAKAPKPKRPRPPNLVRMHISSTSTCMNFMSRFYFLTPMDCSPWSESEILAKA